MKQLTPELTIRAAVLGAILSVLLCAANAYLGLFAGMTVSASIPAAVVSMAILRGLRGGILENNLVQTAASAGESAAAGAIFTLPALLLLGAVSSLDPFSSAFLVGTGGVLGVLFTIPLRRALVTLGELPFPEGVATAEVLKAGHAQSAPAGLRALALGAGYGALVKLLSSGLQLARGSLEGAVWFRGGAFALGTSLSPALAAVGAIVGLPIALLMLSGGVLNWLVFVPAATEPNGLSALAAAGQAWSEQTRYLGVGAMGLGGLWTLLELRSALLGALMLGKRAAFSQEEEAADLPRSVLLVLTGIAGVCALSALWVISGSFFLSLLLLVLVFAFGFLFCGVAAYMAGLVGSSNNPVSGVTLATILLTSLLLLVLGFTDEPSAGRQLGSASAILVGTMVCTAAAIGGDNMQDLKAGQLLGARPARQQIAQLIGVLAAAGVIAPVLNLLHEAYGFGTPSAAFPHALRAPQAALMASVAQGVFRGGLPWAFVCWGALAAALVIAADGALRRRKSAIRLPVLAFSVGIYLPLELTAAMLFGALVARLRPGAAGKRLLASAGLITGEALMGIALAVSVAFGFSLDGLLPFTPKASGLLGAGLFLGALGVLWGRRRASSEG